jgi:phosphoglycolate phosphatase
MRTVLFDLDGTLADTSGDLLAAANACFRGLGLPDLLIPGPDDGIAHRGGRAMLRAGFERVTGYGEAEVDAQYAVLLEHYAQNIDRFTVLYDGAREAVSHLSAKGYIVAICTNKPEGLAETLMRKLNFRAEFSALLGADTLTVRKPDADHVIQSAIRAGGDPSRACLVGDTKTDRDAAKNANVPSILVTFGPNSHTVSDLQPEATIDHFDELVGVVEALNL